MSLRNSLQFAAMAAVVSAQLALTISAVAQATSSGQQAATSSALHLNVTLSGASTAPLQSSEITLLDNGATLNVTQIQQAQTSGTPTRVILVIDDVNARLTTVAYERNELKKFLTANDGRLASPFAIAVMTDTGTQIQQGFSQNGIADNDVLQKYQIALHQIRRSSQYGGFDRTDIGIRTLQQLVQYAASVPGHKLILFVSPGWPLLTGPRIDLTSKDERRLFDAVAGLQDGLLASNTTLGMVNPFGPEESPARSDYYQAFLKGVKHPKDVDIADLSLQVLATHSGGFVLQGSSDIAGMVNRSLADLQNTYTLTVEPPAESGDLQYHSLAVQVNRPNVKVRAPDEYYAGTSNNNGER